MKTKSFLLTTLIAILAVGNIFAQRFQVGELEFEIISDEDKTVSLIGGDLSTIKELIIPETVSYDDEIYTVTTIHATFYYSDLIAVTIPNSVTSIECLRAGESLQFVNIGISVETISDGAFSYTQAYFFVDPDNPFFSSENGILYNKDKTVLVCCQTADKDDAVKMPETVEKLAIYSFMGNSLLKKVTISSAVTEIGDFAFADCKSLKTVVSLPAVPPGPLGLTDTGAWESQLTCDVYVPMNSFELYDLKWGGSYTIYPIEFFPVSDEIFTIDNLNFRILSEKEKLVEVAGIKNQEETVLISSTIEYEGNVYKVVMVGCQAFLNKYAIETIKIPSSIFHVSSRAFVGCTSLKNVFLESTIPPQLGKGTFWRYSNAYSNLQVSIYVPDEAVDAYRASNWGEFKILPVSSYVEPPTIPSGPGLIGEWIDEIHYNIGSGHTYSMSLTSSSLVFWEDGSVYYTYTTSESTYGTVIYEDYKGKTVNYTDDGKILTIYDGTELLSEMEYEIMNDSLHLKLINGEPYPPLEKIFSSVMYPYLTEWTYVKKNSNQNNSDSMATLQEESKSMNVYSIDGRFIRSLKNEEEIPSLERGLYIVGGRKVIVNH